MSTQIRTATAAPAGPPPVTVEEWARMPGPPHYELVDGILVEKPDVAFWHDIMLPVFQFFLVGYAHARGIGLFAGPTAKVRINAIRGRMPDIVFIPREMYHLVGANLFRGVPPMVAELLSPENEDLDRRKKFREYAGLGIGEYWIVDFPNRRIEVYRLGDGEYHLFETAVGDAVFRPAMFPGLEIPLARVWPTEFENRTDQ